MPVCIDFVVPRCRNPHPLLCRRCQDVENFIRHPRHVSACRLGESFLVKSLNALRLLRQSRYPGGHLRATPTKLSQNPLLPASADLLVLPCTARTAIAAVITASACITALLVPLPLPSFLCAIVLSALVVSNFAIFVFSASPLLPFVDFLCRSFRVAFDCVLLH